MKEQRKGGNGERKNIRNVLEIWNGLGLQTNSLTPFLKAAMLKMKAKLFSALVIVPYQEPSQTSRMYFSAKIVNDSKLLIIFTKCPVLVVRLGSKYAFENSATEYMFSNNFQAFLYLIIWQVSDRCSVYHSRRTFKQVYYTYLSHMFNHLMLGGNNRSCALKQIFKFYLLVFI